MLPDANQSIGKADLAKFRSELTVRLVMDPENGNIKKFCWSNHLGTFPRNMDFGNDQTTTIKLGGHVKQIQLRRENETKTFAMKITLEGEQQPVIYGKFDDLPEGNHLNATWDFNDNEDLIGFDVKADREGIT